MNATITSNTPVAIVLPNGRTVAGRTVRPGIVTGTVIVEYQRRGETHTLCVPCNSVRLSIWAN